MTDLTTTFSCFTGTYTLERNDPPAPGQQALRAWDAADEYLLSAAAPLLGERPNARVLIVNDAFGALAVALHAFAPHTWGDSFAARRATAENLERNGLPEGGDARFFPATITPPGLEGANGAPSGYDLVLWRVPKARALFEQQREGLRPLLHADTVVLAGGMVKHLTDRAKDILSGLGAVSVLPVEKKAVLLRVAPQPDLPPLPPGPEPVLSVPEYGVELTAGPNVFAREKLDEGARLFLAQFGALPRARRIADLGCGNGVLGIVARRLQRGAEVHFFDESYQAVAAAEENYRRNVPAAADASAPAAHFHVDDGLIHYEGDAFDLVLCNPPFHQGHAIGDQTAWQMFSQSKRHLRPGGELWVVGNRHLEYHLKLRRLFGNCRQIAAHPKFVVLAAVKR
jgi:16S RNA G1207 methylase RsmC